MADWQIGFIACSMVALAHAQRIDQVQLPPATFTMGTNESRVAELMARFSSKRRELFASELPAREVQLRAFMIDRAEVTNAAFNAFVDGHPEWSRVRLAADRHNGEYLETWAGGLYPAGADPWKDSYLDGAKTSPGRRVIRGGSFGGSPVNLRVRYRDSHPELGAGPHVGFRCAR